MRYALLIYNTENDPDRASRDIPGTVVEMLDEPFVDGWARLHAAESATTLHRGGLLTDGPFVESKEYLAGLIVIEAENLDAALAVAQQVHGSRPSGAIEVRPVLDGRFRGA
ncbi:hypothetical protein HH310_00935 [Actinoplanes sp. TBRC 11911]|uniref:YciI family protein n=1 Tax=Actinoplanes sp. TBRC 11911 TaxID=2729386 RepID=UPI00145D4702|nr:YciI family protein [Actinoplanes sp. TBRC 11911]NMO49765.1 hypothetical protein [Actinoplanes sp. TBRC 11911]